MDKVKKLRTIGISGVILLFPNLILNIINVLEIFAVSMLFLIITASLFAVGGIMVFVSTIMLRDERRKEKIKSMYSVRN